MKNVIYIFCLYSFIFGCKKDPPQPRYDLFLSFEKDGKFFSFEGTELSYRPGFSSTLTESVGTNSTIFKMESWCALPENLENISGGFHVDFIHFSNSHLLLEDKVDEIFSEGVKGLEHPQVTTGSDSLDFITNVSFTTAHSYSSPVRFLDCDTLRHFEITNFEKNYNEEQELVQVVIDADFDISMCGDNGDTTKFENGKLRFFYILY
jgi:hypothetical protein